MKQIDISTPTYPNIFALVDDEDYERVNQIKWHPKANKNGTLYAMAKIGPRGNKTNLFMHGFILKTLHGLLLCAGILSTSNLTHFLLRMKIGKKRR